MTKKRILAFCLMMLVIAAGIMPDRAFAATENETILDEAEPEYTAESSETAVIFEEPATDTHVHTLVQVEAQNPTCEEEGHTTYWICEECAKLFSSETGDSETEITLEDTVIEKLGHSLVMTEAKAPTCEEEGNIAFWICQTCGKIFSSEAGSSETEISPEDVVIGKLEHTWDEGTVKVEPTPLSEGIMVFTCTVCGAEREETIEPLEIKVPAVSISSAKLTADGVSISWNQESGIDGYYIYRDGTPIETITDPAQTAYLDTTNLESGRLYSYQIAAYKEYEDTDYFSSLSQEKNIVYFTRPAISKLSNTTSGVKVQWKAVKGAAGYYVYRGSTKIATVSGGSTVTYTDSAAKTNGTKYTYKIVAYRAVNGTTYKSLASAARSHYYVARPAMSAASNLAAGTKVTWKKLAGATGYYVYRKIGTGSYSKIKTITSGSTVAYTDKAASKNGTQYSYYVIAYKTVGSVTYTSPKSVVKASCFLTRPAIKSLVNKASGTTVTWQKNARATGYYIYRNGKKIKTITSGSTITYTDTGAKTNGTKYTYKIYTYKKLSGTVYKSYVSAAKASYFVARPTIQSASGGNKSITVRWNGISKASGYQIRYGTSGDLVTAGAGGASARSKSISGLRTGTTYTVYIRAYRTVGSVKYYSAWSAAKTATTAKAVKRSSSGSGTSTSSGGNYILNTNTMKFHRPGCSAANRISASNKATSSSSRSTLISQGYDPCKICNP